ncbi:hypothetical protein Tco_0572332 [Tanacetum coccineum]
MAESSSHNPSSSEITPKEEPVIVGRLGEREEATDGSDHSVFMWENKWHGSNIKQACHHLILSAYNNEELIINPTQVFSVHNWVLKPNQHEGPPFTDHMKDIYNIDVPVDSQAPKTSSQSEKVPQGKKPRAKSGLGRKYSLKHTFKYPSPPTPVVGEMHKKVQQAAGGPTSLRATSKERAYPQLSSGMSAFILIKPVYSASFIFTLSLHQDVMLQQILQLKTDPGLFAPNDSIPSQQDQTKSAGNGLKISHTESGTNEESGADEISKKIKLEDLSDLLKDTRSTFFTPDFPQDEPIIVSDESEEEETEKDEDTHATSHNIPEDTLVPYPPSPKAAQIQELMAQVHLLQSQKEKLEQQKAKAKEEVASLKARPSYPDINQLTKLLVTSLKPELSKLLASHDFASCLPTELKELPLKFTKLSGDIKELKQHVRDMEIELPGDLKEIPTKLESFTSTISSITFQVAELKNIQWELPTEFLDLPSQISSVQKKLKTLDSLPSLLNKVTKTLNKFATMVENASGATTKDVPSAGQATSSPAEGEKNTNPATTDVEPNMHDELVDLLGIDVATQYYNKKLLFDKYRDKVLKRRKSSKITNYDVLTQKGPISLQVHKEDGTIEVISNVKVSDLHLAE